MSEWLIIPKQLPFAPKNRMSLAGLGWLGGPGFRDPQAEARCLATGESPEFC